MNSIAFAQIQMNMPMPKAKTTPKQGKPVEKKASPFVKKNKQHAESATVAHSGNPAVSVIGGGKTIRYDLYVRDTTVNYTSKNAMPLLSMVPYRCLPFILRKEIRLQFMCIIF